MAVIRQTAPDRGQCDATQGRRSGVLRGIPRRFRRPGTDHMPRFHGARFAHLGRLRWPRPTPWQASKAAMRRLTLRSITALADHAFAIARCSIQPGRTVTDPDPGLPGTPPQVSPMRDTRCSNPQDPRPRLHVRHWGPWTPLVFCLHGWWTLSHLPVRGRGPAAPWHIAPTGAAAAAAVAEPPNTGSPDCCADWTARVATIRPGARPAWWGAGMVLSPRWPMRRPPRTGGPPVAVAWTSSTWCGTR